MKPDGNCMVMDMTFGAFTDIYLDSVGNRISKKSLINKKSILDKYILPYFGDMALKDISYEMIDEWQGRKTGSIDPKTGKRYTASYVKTIRAHLRAVLNYAKEYSIPIKEDGPEIWEMKQYWKFSEAMLDRPIFFYVFETMYWCGLTGGEVQALTLEDIDFGERVIAASNDAGKRYVVMPQFLCNELRDYADYIYRPKDNGKLFPVSGMEMIYELKKGAEKAGIKEIRLSGLTKSGIALLLSQGFCPDDISGWAGAKGGYRCRQVLSKQEEIADKLNSIKWRWLRFEG